MASVQLDTVLLALASDLAVQVSLEVSSLEEDDGVDGGVRTYANGRQRSVSHAGRPRSLSLEFDAVQDRGLLDTLRSWKGQVVLLRDPYGRKLYGVYYRIALSEQIPVDVVTGSLVITEVTYSEAV